MSEAPWWVTLAGIALTGLLAWSAQAWAARGKKVVDTSTLALDMVKELRDRVETLERVDAWRSLIHAMDTDHITLLRDLIYRQQPPPPPERPIYPPRPS